MSRSRIFPFLHRPAFGIFENIFELAAGVVERQASTQGCHVGFGELILYRRLCKKGAPVKADRTSRKTIIMRLHTSLDGSDENHCSNFDTEYPPREQTVPYQSTRIAYLSAGRLRHRCGADLQSNAYPISQHCPEFNCVEAQPPEVRGTGVHGAACLTPSWRRHRVDDGNATTTGPQCV